jgi:hypothetical protein
LQFSNSAVASHLQPPPTLAAYDQVYLRRLATGARSPNGQGMSYHDVYLRSQSRQKRYTLLRATSVHLPLSTVSTRTVRKHTARTHTAGTDIARTNTARARRQHTHCQRTHLQRTPPAHASPTHTHSQRVNPPTLKPVSLHFIFV